MKAGILSEYFDSVAVKRLSAVEADPEKSNQHEFAGGHLRKMFGEDDRLKIPAQYIWLSDEQEGVSEPGFVSWYDSRRKVKHRGPEYRLYYDYNPVASMMKEGDSFFVATRPDGDVMVIVTPKDSTVENQLSWLFGIKTDAETFSTKDEIDNSRLDFAARYILDELGIEAEEPEAAKLDTLIDKFGNDFPKTTEFAKLARDSLTEVKATDDPDAVIVAWIDRELNLFKRLERRIVSERLSKGFMNGKDADVDGFLNFSLSVQNRRKSRAGHSLELHIETLLKARGIKYVRGAQTEGKSRPDFLFPGIDEYHNKSFPTEKLTMLGSKSTLKDRWRQVLDEADRITHKHLLTLEPGISEAQTNAMKARNLQLVVPQAQHETFTADQQKWLMNVDGFVKLAESRQKS